MLLYLLEFVGLFVFITVLGYLVPAGRYYRRFHVGNHRELERFRIQHREIPPGQIAREIKMSLVTIAIFAAMGTALIELFKAGHTSIIYWERAWQSPLWALVSFALCFIIHDTYFYWTHRLMHWRPFFKYTHLGHHRSVSPTPWAIFAFQPAEAVIQGLGIMGLVIFLPLHPIVLLGFLAVDTEVNTAGHCGYEMVPRFISSSPLFSGFSTVTHHDRHHTNMSKNYGSFFNVWDRVMGTFLDATTPAETAPPQPVSRSRERINAA